MVTRTGEEKKSHKDRKLQKESKIRRQKETGRHKKLENAEKNRKVQWCKQEGTRIYPPPRFMEKR